MTARPSPLLGFAAVRPPARRMRRLAPFALVATMAVAAEARGDGLRVHGLVNAAVPATGPQKNEQSWGASTNAMLEWALMPQLGVGVSVGALSLSDGSPPSDPTLADADGAAGVSGTLGVHLRPSATANSSEQRWHSGLWTGSHFGLMRSNGLLRMMSEVNVGYDFALGSGGLSAGPSLGWMHVFQPDDALRPADANVLSFGLHALFDSPDPAAAVEPPAPVAADADGDGLADANDQCPAEAEDADGFEDADGCPDADNDRDGLADADDQCPLDAEDRDDFQDEDGCPDDDNDGDGIADRDDSCPDEAEVENGYADADGCPDEQQVRVVGDQIVLDDRIHFHTNSAIIRRPSYGLLMNVSQLLNAHPEYVHVEIQGHTDPRGAESFNQRLSERRAMAVMDFLIEMGGVDAVRLHATGHGSSRPLVSSEDEHSLYLNRRVEFIVTRRPRSGKGAP